MRRLFMFSVSVFLLALTLLIGLHEGARMAKAGSAAPVATEVVTASGAESIPGSGQVIVPWPTFSDGTSANETECSAIGSPSTDRTSGTLSIMTTSETSAGFEMNIAGSSAIVYYLIVCSRAAPGGPVSTESVTWGEVKARYQD